jgi:hypothetical protein
MAISIVRLAIVAVVSGTLWSLRQQARRRRDERAQAKPPAEQTWEGEGGALPATGSQTGPDPASLTLP